MSQNQIIRQVTGLVVAVVARTGRIIRSLDVASLTGLLRRVGDNLGAGVLSHWGALEEILDFIVGAGDDVR